MGPERDSSADRRARFGSEGQPVGMSCGRSGVADHRNPTLTQNRFSVFKETEVDGETLEPSDSNMQNRFLLMRDSNRVSSKEPAEGRKKRPSRCVKSEDII